MDDNECFNGFESDTYILQIITQQELEKLTYYLEMNKMLKKLNFQSKLEIFIKLEKIILLALLFLVMKTRKNNIQFLCEEILSKDMLIYY